MYGRNYVNLQHGGKQYRFLMCSVIGDASLAFSGCFDIVSFLFSVLVMGIILISSVCSAPLFD